MERSAAAAEPESAPHAANAEASSSNAIAWRIQPLVVRTPQFLLGLLAVLMISLLVAWVDGDAVTGAIAALILFAVLINAFLPSAYRIDDEGLLVDHPLRRRRIPWGEIRRIGFDAQGALVRFGAGRGRQVTLSFPREPSRVDAIVAALRRRSDSGEFFVLVDRRAVGRAGDAADDDRRSR